MAIKVKRITTITMNEQHTKAPTRRNEMMEVETETVLEDDNCHKKKGPVLFVVLAVKLTSFTLYAFTIL